MFGLGFGEVLIILLIALIFIGPKKLPELAKGLGKGLREFQNATKGLSEQINQTKEEISKAVTESEPLSEEATHNSAPQITTTEEKDPETPS
jgi:sec-independent protein translocase protein TatA